MGIWCREVKVREGKRGKVRGKVDGEKKMKEKGRRKA